jgi:F-type H+-transporting ATPase subunit delta
MLTEELGTTEAALSDVRVSEVAFRENPSYTTLTDTPALSPEVKLSLISEAFASVDESVGNLIKILCERHSVYLFPEVAKEYVDLYNESRGICTAEAISATPLTDKQMKAISDKLAAMTGKTIILKNTIDPAVLGGLKLRYMGTQLDGSLRARLDAIESGIKKTIL